jgi:hypothetical protein
MNKAPLEIVTVCLIVTAGFFVSEMLSTGADHAFRSSQSAPTEIASIAPAPSIAQFTSGAVQIPEPARVWYKSAEAPTKTGLEWMFPKGPPLHLLDLRNRL